jgi:hypothetical protein
MAHTMSVYVRPTSESLLSAFGHQSQCLALHKDAVMSCASRCLLYVEVRHINACKQRQHGQLVSEARAIK